MEEEKKIRKKKIKKGNLMERSCFAFVIILTYYVISENQNCKK